MVKVFRDIVSLILYEAVFIFIDLVIVIKRFKPVVDSVIKLIFIGIFLVIKDVIVTFIFKPYKGETRIILVFFIVFIVSVSNLYHIIIRTVHDHYGRVCRRESVQCGISRVFSVFDPLIDLYKRRHGIDQIPCLRFSA